MSDAQIIFDNIDREAGKKCGIPILDSLGGNYTTECEHYPLQPKPEAAGSVHFSSLTPEWSTPQDFFDKLNKEFNFTLDPCATKENAKCAKFYTKEDDGLSKSWEDEMVFMNPPYGREIGKWVAKIAEEGGVALLPARTDTRWFHEYIYGKAEVRFVKGRLKFGGSKTNAPFPSMIVIFPKPEAVEAKPTPAEPKEAPMGFDEKK